QYYGRLFFAFLLVNVPINVSLTMLLLTGQMSGFAAIFAINLITLQICIIFAVHLAMANYPKLIHRPAKMLLSLCLKMASRFRYNARLHLQMEHCIAVFHTTNLYAIPYTSFGMVTMNNFCKVC